MHRPRLVQWFVKHRSLGSRPGLLSQNIRGHRKSSSFEKTAQVQPPAKRVTSQVNVAHFLAQSRQSCTQLWENRTQNRRKRAEWKSYNYGI